MRILRESKEGLSTKRKRPASEERDGGETSEEEEGKNRRQSRER